MGSLSLSIYLSRSLQVAATGQLTDKLMNVNDFAFHFPKSYLIKIVESSAESFFFSLPG